MFYGLFWFFNADHECFVMLERVNSDKAFPKFMILIEKVNICQQLKKSSWHAFLQEPETTFRSPFYFWPTAFHLLR